jgi:hypothetical protein
VLDNFVPRTLDSRGLDYAGVRQLRPDVIMTRMPGWGLTGSWSGRAAYTELVESASGTASLTATDDGVPHRTGRCSTRLRVVTPGAWATHGRTPRRCSGPRNHLVDRSASCRENFDADGDYFW